ncbi:hypothetical protein SAY87_022860 [Trapa incisa]|uniref:Uncharacterized protein n=1 Tax=Trapa incisa TaxID=236973 RepID=A0AAN7K4T8_9MYRT|nr:hypothetical protein SAY87_022860 [Trapa incisa]
MGVHGRRRTRRDTHALSKIKSELDMADGRESGICREKHGDQYVINNPKYTWCFSETMNLDTVLLHSAREEPSMPWKLQQRKPGPLQSHGNQCTDCPGCFIHHCTIAAELLKVCNSGSYGSSGFSYQLPALVWQKHLP